jgi:hypothetical protein
LNHEKVLEAQQCAAVLHPTDDVKMEENNRLLWNIVHRIYLKKKLVVYILQVMYN